MARLSGPAAARPGRAGARLRRGPAKPLAPHVAEPLLAEAAKILGASAWLRSDTAAGRRALGLAAERVAEGSTTADLLSACRVAAARWSRGDRWPPLKSFTYVWGAFMHALIAGGDGARSDRDAPTFRRDEERDEWQKSLAEAPDAPSEADLLVGGDKTSVERSE